MLMFGLHVMSHIRMLPNDALSRIVSHDPLGREHPEK